MSLPQPGDTNWGTTLNNFLLTAHNDDGSIKNSAGSGGVTNIEVLSQSSYDGLASKSNTTLYIIV